MGQTAFITPPDCVLHQPGDHHPESPARWMAIQEAIRQSGLMSRLQLEDVSHATRRQIERAHSASHVEDIFSVSPARGLVYLDPDTAMGPQSLSAALHAAGAGVLAVDRVLNGQVRNAFCAVRPPGHHAERNRAMGFCLFNSVAIAALHALEAHGLERVAILDFDVHHGNGTEDIFRQDSRVLFCSTFQHPYYPHQGADTVSDHIVNVPLPAGTTGPAFREAILRRCLPAMEAFSPQLVILSAGFDAHREDPLAQLCLEDDDYDWVTRQMTRLAGRHCGGAIVSMLEGGYDVAALGRSVVAHVQALTEAV